MSRVDSTLLSLVSSPFIVSQHPLTDLPSREYQMGAMMAEPNKFKKKYQSSYVLLYLTNNALLRCGVGENHGEQGMKEESGSDAVGVTLLSE